MQTYWEFLKPAEIAAANGRVVYAYGSRTLRASSSATGLVTALWEVYYTPGIHARLVSFSRLLQQGWMVHCSKTKMELCTEESSLFTNVKMANNVYPVKLDIAHLSPVLAAWTVDGVAEPAPDGLVECLEKVARWSPWRRVQTAEGRR